MKGNLEEHISSSLNTKEFASDEDQVLFRLKGASLAANDTRERCREVDVRSRFLLNCLNDASFATRDDVVELVVDLADFRV